jgi:hypothetical protein
MKRFDNAIPKLKMLVWPVTFGLALGLSAAIADAQKPETPRKTTAGDGPAGVPQATFFVHRLGTDHAEGINHDGHERRWPA